MPGACQGLPGLGPVRPYVKVRGVLHYQWFALHVFCQRQMSLGCAQRVLRTVRLVLGSCVPGPIPAGQRSPSWMAVSLVGSTRLWMLLPCAISRARCHQPLFLCPPVATWHARAAPCHTPFLALAARSGAAVREAAGKSCGHQQHLCGPTEAHVCYRWRRPFRWARDPFEVCDRVSQPLSSMDP